ncbi:AMP-dependent synthetase [Ancylomarina euxinus]|uniref:AMP-dependent synthetase n=1 Tax=Ancylomarina euxinus TaxID=2283627 RepID=A0A425Y6H3_9BACT|nr:AMP-binding protein [Ancylomarina euxinus]MCZ4694022.1 AMP-binding protein [Ancylomarina euxinus]MUP14558.1 AMP-binding protein [Ancylomarina euxinus]RRG24107.1 AMP-dependent synthetase [Ancylomarina euxinus]
MNVVDYLFLESESLDKDFVIGPNETIAYKQIYKESMLFANYLKNLIGEKQGVLLASENSVLFIVTYLAIIKSGNICIPIDPTIEQDNFEYIVKTSKSKCIVFSDRFTKIISKSVDYKIDKNRFDEIIKNSDLKTAKFSDEFDSNRIAEILYTSGSTGIPKGVMISHKNIIANTNSIISYLKLKTDDIMGVVLPFYYCYGLSLLHTHLKVGASLVLINNFIFLPTVINNIKGYNCTGFAGVPSHFQILLKKSESFKNTNFPNLRYVTQAGGKLHNSFIEEFIEIFSNIEFFVMYGQTEATARLSYLPPEKLKEKIGSIGKSIPDVILKVLNENGEVAETGELGEIVAKGDNIMRGYFKDKEGTKDVLKNGWLYTGDIGSMDEDGFIYLQSRKKEIIKVGGKRVSPKEIEEVIVSINEVVDCTVIAVRDDLLGEAIKAIVVLKNDCDEKQIKKQILKKCHQKLQIHKVPQLICFEEAMQVSSSGKKIRSHSII